MLYKAYQAAVKQAQNAEKRENDRIPGMEEEKEEAEKKQEPEDAIGGAMGRNRTLNSTNWNGGFRHLVGTWKIEKGWKSPGRTVQTNGWKKWMINSMER